MTKRIGLYAGSFDPFQLGHLDLAIRAAELLDTLYLGIGDNPEKQDKLFSAVERVELVNQSLNWYLLTNPSLKLATLMDRIRVLSYDTLVNEAADRVEARYLVRGMRASDDFSGEWDLAGILCKVAPHLEFIHLMARPAHIFERSKYVRQLAMFCSPDLELFVAPPVAQALKEKYPRC